MGTKANEMHDKIIKYLETLQKNKLEVLKALEGPLTSLEGGENKTHEIQVMILRAEVNQLDGIIDAIKTLL